MPPPVYDERDEPLPDLGALAVAMRYTGTKLTARARELQRIGREIEVDPHALAEQAAAVGIHVAGLTLELAALVDVLAEHHRRDREQRARLVEEVRELRALRE